MGREARVFLASLQSELVNKEMDVGKPEGLLYAVRVEGVCLLQAPFE